METNDMIDSEVGALEFINWNAQALNGSLSSCLITTAVGEVGTLVRRVLQAQTLVLACVHVTLSHSEVHVAGSRREETVHVAGQDGRSWKLRALRQKQSLSRQAGR